MKNGYKLLTLLTDTLNKSTPLVEDILKVGKEVFSDNEEYISIGIGILNEIKNIFDAVDEEFFVLNKKIYDSLLPLVNYSRKLFNNYGFVNAYKLYDVLSIDLENLKKLLNF